MRIPRGLLTLLVSGLWCVHFIATDRLVSSGKDGVVRLWDAATGESVSKLEGHTGLVRALALSPDGSTLASVSRDGNLFLWNFADGKVVAKVEEGVLGFQCVVFVDGGKRLATGGIDRMVRVWDVAELRTKHKVD
jgi:WD40 repeat protein